MCIPATVAVLNTEDISLYSYDSDLHLSVKTDVTTYIQVVTCFSLFSHSIGVLLAFFNCLLAYFGLLKLANRCDSKKRLNSFEFLTELPDKLFKEEYKPYRG